MKESVKIAIISVIATLAIASLIFAVLLKTGVIEINSQRARDTEKTVISDNNQSEITEGELEDGVLVLGNEEDLIAIQNKESGYEQITCIKEYDLEDVKFQAPCTWVLDQENSSKNDIRLNNGDYIVRLHGFFGVTGGGFGHFFDGICGAGMTAEYSNVVRDYYRSDEYVNYNEVTDCDCIKFTETDTGVDNCNWNYGDQDLWFGSYLVKSDEAPTQGKIGIGAISHTDVFPEENIMSTPAYFSVELINKNIADRKASGVFRGDEELTDKQSQYNAIVKTVELKIDTDRNR